jgi:hypothetical protein
MNFAEDQLTQTFLEVYARNIPVKYPFEWFSCLKDIVLKIIFQMGPMLIFVLLWWPFWIVV